MFNGRKENEKSWSDEMNVGQSDYSCFFFFFCGFQLGGPSWNLLLGRRDSTTASLSAANSNIPGPSLNLNALISAFSNKGFTAREMVALSGLFVWWLMKINYSHLKYWSPLQTPKLRENSQRDLSYYRVTFRYKTLTLYVCCCMYAGGHTIGQARCTVFRNRIYNEANINASFAASLKANCPSSGGDNNLSPLDTTSPNSFDNAYFRNLQTQKGLLHSDQQLFNGGSTDALVNTYSSNSATFFADFASAMVKMDNLSPLTGTNGQIRTNCRRTN